MGVLVFPHSSHSLAFILSISFVLLKYLIVFGTIFAYAPEQRNISAEIWRIIITLRHSPDIDRLDYRSTSMGFILIPNFSSPHSVAAW